MLQTVLRSTHDRSLNKYAAVDEEDDFQEVLDPPPIAAATQYQVCYQHHFCILVVKYLMENHLKFCF